MTIFNKITKLLRCLYDSDYRFCVLGGHSFYHDMSDEEYLKRMFKAKMGYELNLDTPVTFNEKLQWLKLHDRNPLYTTLVDKYAVKKHVADKSVKSILSLRWGYGSILTTSTLTDCLSNLF